ncbi:gamma-aminobutyric acid type B receptor subunit 2-like, partial [Pomacea canaliculata]|uniref:gamma-aminobutyric acid type B receptor subunit 2-like n=1 Tax=Pomacea canaliculata TaxID=400727 RepID=UPI000D72D1AB
AKFPLFARVTAPDTQTNPVRLLLLQTFGWRRVATIHQSYDLFAATTENLVRLLQEANITIIRSEIFMDDPTPHVKSLKDNDCRIIVGAFYQDKARKVFCEAYKVGLYGSRVVWLLPGWYDAGWWLMADPAVDCSPGQLIEAVEGHFDTGILSINPRSERAISGWLPSEFTAAYKAAAGGRHLPGDTIVSQGYDAVWALALALNRTQEQLTGSSKGLEDFTYENSEMARMLYNNLLQVSFTGVRGPITFDANGDPVGLVSVGRVQGGEKQTVCVYNPTRPTGQRLEWSTDTPLLWEGGLPPRDSTMTRTEYVTLSLPLYVTTCVLAALGVLLTCAFLAFNIVLRNARLVKMSSPRLNNVILLGCVCTYSSVFVQDAGGEHGVLACEIKTALLAVGVSLAFASLFAKTWRVYVIFTSTKVQRRVMHDGHLLAIVAALVFINLLVLLSWWILDPRTLQVTRTTTVEESEAGGVVLVMVQRCELTCRSDRELYFLGTLYGLHALVLLLGTFLAWETRKAACDDVRAVHVDQVHYPELNDSKFIGLCIYNVALLSILAVVVTLTVDSSLNLRHLLNSTLVLLGTTVTQCLIFVPKVMTYRHNRVDDDNKTTVHTIAAREVTAKSFDCSNMSGQAAHHTRSTRDLQLLAPPSQTDSSIGS